MVKIFVSIRFSILSNRFGSNRDRDRCCCCYVFFSGNIYFRAKTALDFKNENCACVERRKIRFFASKSAANLGPFIFLLLIIFCSFVFETLVFRVNPRTETPKRSRFFHRFHLEHFFLFRPFFPIHSLRWHFSFFRHTQLFSVWLAVFLFEISFFLLLILWKIVPVWHHFRSIENYLDDIFFLETPNTDKKHTHTHRFRQRRDTDEQCSIRWQVRNKQFLPK